MLTTRLYFINNVTKCVSQVTWLFERRRYHKENGIFVFFFVADWVGRTKNHVASRSECKPADVLGRSLTDRCAHWYITQRSICQQHQSSFEWSYIARVIFSTSSLIHDFRWNLFDEICLLGKGLKRAQSQFWFIFLRHTTTYWFQYLLFDSWWCACGCWP